MASIARADLLAQLVTGDVGRLQALLPPAGELPGRTLSEMPNGVTPLMIAAACGHEEVVALLLQCGEDPARRDARGKTAAAYARNAGHPHLAERLDTVVDKECTIW